MTANDCPGGSKTNFNEGKGDILYLIVSRDKTITNYYGVQGDDSPPPPQRRLSHLKIMPSICVGGGGYSILLSVYRGIIVI